MILSFQVTQEGPQSKPKELVTSLESFNMMKLSWITKYSPLCKSQTGVKRAGFLVSLDVAF